MAGSVILAGAARRSASCPVLWVASPPPTSAASPSRRPRAVRGRARPGRLRVHGAGAAGRHRPDHRPPGRDQRRHPHDRAARTVNKVCLSGLNAIFLADLLIQSAPADIVVASGMESDDPGPLPVARRPRGLRLGDKSVVDSMMYDGLFCAFDQVAMGAGTEEYAASAGLAHEPQDDLAAKSHEQPPPPSRRGASRRRSSRSRCPSARATRSWSTPTRASAPAPRPSRWPSSARVRQGRQHHRRQRLADLRRGRRRGGGVQGGGRPPGRRAAGRDVGLRPGGRPRPVAAHPAVAGHQRRPSRRPAGRWATSICSSSTRRSPRWAWRR